MKPLSLHLAAAYTLAGLLTITLGCALLATLPHYWPFTIGLTLWAYRFHLTEEKPLKLTDADIWRWVEHG